MPTPQMSQRPSSDPPSISFRQKVLTEPGVTHLASRPDPDQAHLADLVACASAGKRPCFVLLYFIHDRLIEVDLCFTEAEARARFEYGRTYDLESFALSPSILASM